MLFATKNADEIAIVEQSPVVPVTVLVRVLIWFFTVFQYH